MNLTPHILKVKSAAFQFLDGLVLFFRVYLDFPYLIAHIPGNEPLGSIKAQDTVKAILMVIMVAGLITLAFGSDIVRELLTPH